MYKHLIGTIFQPKVDRVRAVTVTDPSNMRTVNLVIDRNYKIYNYKNGMFHIELDSYRGGIHWVVSLDEFITIFDLPKVNNWKIRGSSEVSNIIQHWDNINPEKINIIGYKTDEFYYPQNYNNLIKYNSNEDFMEDNKIIINEIEFEFLLYNLNKLKQQTMSNVNIVYTLSPEYSQYEKAACKIINKPNLLSLDQNNITALSEAGILDIWFLKNTKIKPGDIVYVLKGWGNHYHNGDMFEVEKISNNGYVYVKGTTSDNCKIEDVRLATPDEIQKYQIVKLPGTDYHIKKVSNGITIADYHFDQEWLDAAKIVMKHSKADIIVGCGVKSKLGYLHQWKYPHEIIKAKILV